MCHPLGLGPRLRRPRCLLRMGPGPQHPLGLVSPTGECCTSWIRHLGVGIIYGPNLAATGSVKVTPVAKLPLFRPETQHTSATKSIHHSLASYLCRSTVIPGVESYRGCNNSQAYQPYCTKLTIPRLNQHSKPCVTHSRVSSDHHLDRYH